MTEPPGSHREWQAEYERRSRLDPLRAVLDAGDTDNRKNEYADLVERVHLGRLLSHLRPRRALDLGCGLGRLTPLLCKHAESVTGIDASEALLAVARRDARLRGRLVRADIRELPLAMAAVDLVLTSNVLIHLVEDADWEKACREIARVLRAGGVALLLEHLSPTETRRSQGIIFRSVDEFVRPAVLAGLRVERDIPLRRMPSRLVHWVRKRYLPRPLWPAAAWFEPLYSRCSRVAPTYRDHILMFRRC